MHILADMTPLMTFLVKLNHIDPPRIFFSNFGRNFLLHFPNFDLWRHFGPQNWGNLAYFRQKWPILTKLTPLMTFLTKFMSINLTEIILETFRDKIFWPLSPNFDLWRHFGPPNDPIWAIFTQKMTHFVQIDSH